MKMADPDVVHINGVPVESPPPRFHDRRPGHGTPAKWDEPVTPSRQARQSRSRLKALIVVAGLLLGYLSAMLGAGLIAACLLSFGLPGMILLLVLLTASQKER